MSGRELHDVQHKHDIEMIDLSRSNSQRYCAFTDKNHDLYVMQVSKNVTTPISIGNPFTHMITISYSSKLFIIVL